ncbi:Coagulation factor V [Dissostichus eleginoides]|uniref:ferroxidase n=1 Tax=Dissostichus eleginoides TaxID=100907 RepID=A0AAD9FJ81_DISEL|nr:Coagulation factor V [Dissostichus eleginoides]
MRLCLWVGARGFLPVLVLLTVLHVNAVQPTAKERHYYIAAVEIDWDYAENDTHRFGPTYKKVVFREYDKGFMQAKTHPSWLGLLGPTLRAQEGETIVVTFRNMASGTHSIHPHGVAYGKQSEGANYFDNTSQKEKEDDVVQPNSEHVYYWEVTPDVSPQPSDSTCLTYSYVSHKDVVQDYNSGLIGALLICKPGSLDESGIQIGVEHEYVFLFGVFDERESKYTPKIHANHVKYTINGYAMGTLPDVSVCAHASVSLHLLAMSSDPEVFSVHLNGQVLQHNGHKVSSVGLISGSTASCSMVALHRGRWLLSSHTMKHMEVGMHGFLEVKMCDGFTAPNRRMTIEQKRHSKEWKYYIAAEEIIWDYAPSMPDYVDEDFKLQYLKQSASRIGRKYKKAVYTLYTNESFTERLETKQRKDELGILGPIIKAQIRDVIKIVFKNLASRPYSIYPHGLTIEKSDEGVNYPAGGNQSHGVQPGETHTYVWRVVDEDEPLDGDSRCLTRLYHSAVDAPRDIASGLIGQILICKSRSLNVRGVQLKADKEQHAMLAVFDENKSWYLDDNIRQFCDRSKVNKGDPEFIKSNVMHSINGYVFESGPHLGFCNGEIATWHMSSIGAQDYIQTATFYGHTFEVNGRTEDFLSLYPMTGETITMEMDNIGVWLLASLNSHETTKGMRVKFKDVECYRDNLYDHPDYDYENTFHIWNPQGLDEIKNEEEKPKPVENKPVKTDIDTDMYAYELGLRSLKNQSKDPGVEQLDLSFLDYDAVDVPEDGNVSNVSVSGDAGKESQSKELSVSQESEELLIYLTGNHSEVIKTTTVKNQSHWTYESTHQMEPVDIPDYMMKYFPKETPKATPPPKKIRKVSIRQRPPKGLGMKTKKKKEYKPQLRSGLPLSPRGFGPGMTPRGSRPLLKSVTNEEELIHEPVVIGVPRFDFSDYELYVPGDDPDHLDLENKTADEYEYVNYVDPYSGGTDIKTLNLDDTTKYYLKFSGPNVRTYFIAAEEVAWDYGGYGQRRQDKSEQNSRETKFTKVVFRGYMDSSFSTPDIRGEIDEHLGILGPVIKTEVGQSIMVVFMNKASRPYSLHPNGVTYTKHTEGLSYEDGSEYWYKYDNEVQPNTTFTYIWKVNSKVGPMPTESHCRTWAYYSGVNPERDIHSGLIGPLLVCREGTLEKNIPDMREFTLLFMTFDESQSWYYDENQEMMQRKSKRRYTGQNKKSLQFHSINGIIFSLKGLRMYTNQLVSWYLINMGSPKDFQSINFHGQTFIHKKISSYRQSVYPLLPGSFATLEMYPSKPGLWQLETEIGFNQQKGMQTLFLVLDDDCHRALGLGSGSVKDDQITAINTRGYWLPNLARLNNGGKYNAWSTEQNKSWIQVRDFQRPVVISQVATQGAKQMLQHQFVTKYSISYSTDRKKWIFYKGDSRDLRKVFPGNEEAYVTKGNTFFPPVIGRFIRLHPINWYNKATVRMEFYGCELDGCSVPLGMKSRLIEDRHITASSEAYRWYSSSSWKPAYARLDKQGTINAWQAKYSNMNQWLQVELPQVMKITGIVTQGAKSLGKEMYVISYSLQYSDNGIHWTPYTDDEAITCKTFLGNTDNNDHVKNYIYPPIFSRFIRVIPRSWMTSITMRIELLGCDFE